MERRSVGKLNKEASSKVKGVLSKRSDVLKWFGSATPEPFGTPFVAWIES